MKKSTLLFILIGIIFLSGCTIEDANNNQEVSNKATRSSESEVIISSNVIYSSTNEETTSSSTSTSTLQTTSEETSTTVETENEILSNYTDDQIEYARIWLQLGANQALDTLYIQRIPAGTPIVPSIPESAVFPEDVIQLSGGRRVDGSVTYGSNHNGTIDVYNVPINLYWESYTQNGTPDAETLKIEAQKVLNSTKLVSVDVGDSVQVKRLIQLEQYTGDIVLPNE
ncbi:hypothetical protein D920_02286 [Enterococcus faecalis 13-SD-W-01]|nr:hypothetical protein D920_02286 [Enterococcus faecalis 13-SD-W-01]